MQQRFSKTIQVSPSQCDHKGDLTLEGCFDICQDIAMEHAEELEIGFTQLTPRHLFWLITKTRIRYYRRPTLPEKATLTTWPEKAERVRCNRSYRLTHDDEILMEGKSQWAILNTETGRVELVEHVYPEDLIVPEDSALEEPFSKISEVFEGEAFAVYTVKSTDIDLGVHMNNAAYVKCILSLFSVEEKERMDIREIEIHYKMSCLEGEKINIYRKDTETGMELKGTVRRENNGMVTEKTSFLVKMVMRNPNGSD